jgi:hypothetical protein
MIARLDTLAEQVTAVEHDLGIQLMRIGEIQQEVNQLRDALIKAKLDR